MKIFRLLTTGLFIGALTLMPVASEAQTNNGRRPGASQSGNNRDKHHNAGRPAAPSHSNNHSKPGRPSNPGNHNRPDRPSNSGNHSKPGRPSNPGNHNRPSNPGNHTKPARPGNSGIHNRPMRPSAPHRPVRPSAPALPPRPAMRPHLPVRPHSSWIHRPVPPAAYRPVYRITPLQAILGITLGTTLNVTLNTLRSNNYAIQGYNDNCLYLSNVNAMGYNWPDAILYYSGGALANSTFTYATNSYNTARYNSLFASLSNQYGAPVSYNRGNNAISATWWGYNNQYVTLELYQGICQDGYSRYITSLRIGE